MCCPIIKWLHYCKFPFKYSTFQLLAFLLAIKTELCHHFLGYSLGSSCERLFRLAPLWDSSAASSKYLRLNRCRFIAPGLPATPPAPPSRFACLLLFSIPACNMQCDFFYTSIPATLRLCRQQLFIRQFPKRARQRQRQWVSERERGRGKHFVAWGEGGAACSEGSGNCRFSLCRVESRRH